ECFRARTTRTGERAAWASVSLSSRGWWRCMVDAWTPAAKDRAGAASSWSGSPPQATDPRPQGNAAPAARASASILIVEDHADLRESLTEILEDEGYVVASAANGLDGLNYLQAHPPPRLILLDLKMPVMDGWEFRRRQQEDP